MKDILQEAKQCPMPNCDGQPIVHALGPRTYRCENHGCLLFGAAFSLEAWQALPRRDEPAPVYGAPEPSRAEQGDENYELSNCPDCEGTGWIENHGSPLICRRCKPLETAPPEALERARYQHREADDPSRGHGTSALLKRLTWAVGYLLDHLEQVEREG